MFSFKSWWHFNCNFYYNYFKHIAMLFTTTTPSHNIRHHYVAQKLNFLVDVLKESKRGYDKFISNLSDKQMRQAVTGLSTECSQYITELNNLVKSLGVQHAADLTSDEYIWNYIPSEHIEANEDILTACSKSEGILLNAYREVLNDPGILQSFRTLIKYQLNGILYAFVRIKLLRNVMRRH